MDETLSSAFGPRDLDASKHTVGTVTIVGGSFRFAHAPAIAGLGARAAGAGLVQLMVPVESRMAAAVLVPEATLADLMPGTETPKCDVLAIGMGLGDGEEAEAITEAILAGPQTRLVVDADALNAIARRYPGGSGFGPFPGKELVFTPHEGEAARLWGRSREEVKANRRECAKELARLYGAIVVLKGPGTIVTDGERVYVNDSGNPFMAMGGMGDLLSGIIAARWAYRKGEAFGSASAGVWLHGAAGDELVRNGSDFSLVTMAGKVGSMRVALDKGKEST